MGATLLSFGHYVPNRRVTNAELEDRLGLPEGWIFQRTGIRERRYAASDEALSDLAVRAGEMALARADFDRMRIALLIVATSTPDHLLPPSAPLVAFRLGLAGAGAVDMAGACAGFLYALSFADAFVKAHKKPALVIAANVLSRRTNPTERASVILFADAAGAALIAPDDRENAGARGVHLTSDGAGYDLIKIRAGGSRMPFASSTSANDALLTLVDGRAVFARATSMMAGASRKALADVGAKISDVAHWVPHQANSRIISATQAKLALPDGAVLSSIELYGNSSAATIPLTLSLASETRSFARGDLLLMSAAGAGLTGGAVVWGM